MNIHAHEVFPSEMLGAVLGAPPALGTKSLAKMQEDTGSGRGGIESAWNRVVAALGLHGRRLVLRAGCPNIDEIESALNLALPADYKEWLALHDGEEFTHGRVDYLPTAETRLLPADVTVARWIDNEWFASDDELNRSSHQDDDRIYNVVHHARRVMIASNAFGDGDNMFLDLCPGPRGHVGQVIVAITECDFEVVGDSFGDFLRRLATALEDGLLEVRETASAPRVVAKGTEYGRWESVLRCVEPR